MFWAVQKSFHLPANQHFFALPKSLQKDCNDHERKHS